MKACGIVIEYNPLHNGHIKHIEESKKITKCDVLIGVMSPNFVQRGEPAIVSKDIRVNAALDAGVDIVVELPTLYAVESADIFAKYALQILNALKISYICFGSETGNTEEFLNKYSKSSLLTPHLDFLVSDLMSEGYAYPKAMAMALKQMDEIRLETPNDILGLAYYKQIQKNNYPIKLHTIKRENNYNDDSLNYSNVSAKAIRDALKNNIDIGEYTPMHGELKDNLFYLDEYFDLLKYKIITMSNEELANIHMVEEGIENLFKKKIVESHNMNEFINACVSKRYTFARIKRTIVHILLNTQKEFAREILSSDISYVRLLGVTSKGSQYLKEHRKEIEVQVLSKFRGNSFALLQFEKQATYTYSCVKDELFRSKLYEKEHYLFPIRKEQI